MHETHKFAVMCDTFFPLKLSKFAKKLDDGKYAYSWYEGSPRPVWTWLRGDAEIPYPSLPVALPRLGGRSAAATMRAFPRGHPMAVRPAFLGDPRQARHGSLPHSRGRAGASARRRRSADEDAGRADGVRRRRARARGRVGRGRTPHDAVGPTSWLRATNFAR